MNSIQNGLCALFAVFLSLAILMVILRLWARWIKRVSLQLNDYACVIALVFSAATVGMNYLSTIEGVGKHQIEVSVANTIMILKSVVAVEILWTSANSWVRISVLHFYTTLFPSRPFNLYAWSLLILTAGNYFTTVLAAFLICRPFAFNWDKTIPNGFCGNLDGYYLASSLIGLALDLAIVCAPMPMLWNLKLKPAKKVGLICLFGIGFFICGVTIVRTITVRRLNYEDLPYSLIMNAVWIVIEPCLSVINACLPLLQPIWSSTSMGMKSAFSKISGSGGTSEGTSGVSGGTPSRRYGFAKKPSDLAGSDVDSLKRLKDHHYPLSDLTDSQIEAGYQERINVKPEMQQNGSIMKPKAGIKVRTDWDVQSQG